MAKPKLIEDIENLQTLTEGHTSQLAEQATKISWINPDSYTGTDAEKLQSALNYADSQSDLEVVLTRQYDITGSTLYVNRSVYGQARYIRIRGINGGITKNDAGFIFSSNNIGNLYTERIQVQSLRFNSTAGAGTKVFNFDKMLEVLASNNQYINVDYVAYAIGNVGQTPRFLNENIYGGHGYAFDFVNCYDFVMDNCVVEGREACFINRSDAPIEGNPAPNGHGANCLRITNCLIEGITGSMSVIKLGFTSVGIISGNYFESNTGTDIDLSHNPGYGVTVQNNFIHDTNTSKTCILLPSVAIKANTQSDKYLFMSNMVRGGANMYGFAATPDSTINILSINDCCLDGTFITSNSELFTIYGTRTEQTSTSTGITKYTNKNGVKKYNCQWDDAGVNANSTKACVVNLGYTIGTTPLISVVVKYSTDGVTQYTPSNALFVSNVTIDSSDRTKLNFTLNNNTANWRRTYYDINVIDF